MWLHGNTNIMNYNYFLTLRSSEDKIPMKPNQHVKCITALTTGKCIGSEIRLSGKKSLNKTTVNNFPLLSTKCLYVHRFTRSWTNLKSEIFLPSDWTLYHLNWVSLKPCATLQVCNHQMMETGINQALLHQEEIESYSKDVERVMILNAINKSSICGPLVHIYSALFILMKDAMFPHLN